MAQRTQAPPPEPGQTAPEGHGVTSVLFHQHHCNNIVHRKQREAICPSRVGSIRASPTPGRRLSLRVDPGRHPPLLNGSAYGKLHLWHPSVHQEAAYHRLSPTRTFESEPERVCDCVDFSVDTETIRMLSACKCGPMRSWGHVVWDTGLDGIHARGALYRAEAPVLYAHK